MFAVSEMFVVVYCVGNASQSTSVHGQIACKYTYIMSYILYIST